MQHKPSYNQHTQQKGFKLKIFENLPLSQYQYKQDQPTREDSDLTPKPFQLSAQTSQFIQQNQSRPDPDLDIYLIGESVNEGNFSTPCNVGLQNLSMKSSVSQKSFYQSQEFDSIQYESDASYVNQCKIIKENIIEEAVESSQKQQKKFIKNIYHDENLKEQESCVNQIQNFDYLKSSARQPLSSIQSSPKYVTPKKTQQINEQQYSYEQSYQKSNQSNTQFVFPTIGNLSNFNQFHKHTSTQNVKQNPPNLKIDSPSNQISKINSQVSNQSSMPQQSSNKLQTQKMSVEAKQRLLQFLKDVHFLNGGIIFKKYGRQDHFFPSKRFLQLTPDMKHLILRNDSNEIKKIIPVSQIVLIKMGRRTENFKRFKAQFQLISRSCSLMMKERTLDLEANNSNELDQFVETLSSILSIIMPKIFLGIEHEHGQDIRQNKFVQD